MHPYSTLSVRYYQDFMRREKMKELILARSTKVYSVRSPVFHFREVTRGKKLDYGQWLFYPDGEMFYEYTPHGVGTENPRSLCLDGRISNQTP